MTWSERVPRGRVNSEQNELSMDVSQPYIFSAEVVLISYFFRVSLVPDNCLARVNAHR
jgi:hypothetical protein